VVFLFFKLVVGEHWGIEKKSGQFTASMITKAKKKIGARVEKRTREGKKTI